MADAFYIINGLLPNKLDWVYIVNHVKATERIFHKNYDIEKLTKSDDEPEKALIHCKTHPDCKWKVKFIINSPSTKDYYLLNMMHSPECNKISEQREKMLQANSKTKTSMEQKRNPTVKINIENVFGSGIIHRNERMMEMDNHHSISNSQNALVPNRSRKNNKKKRMEIDDDDEVESSQTN